MIIPSTPYNGILIIIIGSAISIFFFIWAYKSYKRQRSIPQPLKKVTELDLPDTLTAMHRRLIELQKEKAAHTKVSFEVFKKVLPTLAYRIDKVEEEEWSTFENDIKSKIRQAIPPKPYMSIRGRFNFKKWARLNAQWKERVYLSAISIAKKEKNKLFHTKEWTFDDGIKISEWIDGYKWGVKQLRDNDSQWEELFESISNYLKDDALRNLIKKHIDFSLMYNNIYLLTDYSGKFKEDIYSLMLHEALVGSPISPEEAEIALGEVLRDIEKRLKEMNNVKTTIVYCCVRGNEYQVLADNQGNDKDSVFVTLGTGSMITNIKALMGASLPPIIEGGLNANFITFKITELPPSIRLGYLIKVVSNAEKPYKFTAWSETIKSNITAKFTGECRKIIGVGSEETAPS